MDGSNFAEARYTNIFATPLITHTLSDAKQFNAIVRHSTSWKPVCA